MPLQIAIDGEWYDLTNWAKIHPGGECNHAIRVRCRECDFSCADTTRSHPPMHSLTRMPCSGPSFIEKYNGYDATEAFYSLHSKAAIARFKAMRPVEAKHPAPQPHALDAAFRELREKLAKDGWYERNMLREGILLLLVVTMWLAGTYLATTNPWWAIVLMGVSMQQAGWLAHDMTHARDTWFTLFLPFIAGWIGGFDRGE